LITEQRIPRVRSSSRVDRNRGYHSSLLAVAISPMYIKAFTSKEGGMLKFTTNNLKKTAILEALRLLVLSDNPTEVELDIRDEILASMIQVVRSISKRDPNNRYSPTPSGNISTAEKRRREKLQ
jgi:hypothetical protein